jgi:hypothetical protein
MAGQVVEVDDNYGHDLIQGGLASEEKMAPRHENKMMPAPENKMLTDVENKSAVKQQRK